MGILSKVSYLKIHLLSTRVELRSALHVLGVIGDKNAEEKNKKDFYKVMSLVPNLNSKERLKLAKYSK